MMSTLTADPKVPASIADRLRGLRRKLAGWILVDGLSRLLLVTLFLVAMDAVIDRVFKMDTAQRTIMLCVGGVILLAILLWRIARPLFSRISDDALILQVEQQHPGLQQSLISSVQFARDPELIHQGVSQRMIEATIEQGIRRSGDLNFSNILNTAQFKTNLLLLSIGLIGIGSLSWGVAQNDFWRTWFNRNILLSSDQWPQRTYLIIEGVVDGQVIMKRGEDHAQRVTVDASRSSLLDVDVTIEIDGAAGRTTYKMRKNESEREHVYLFRNVSNPFRFRARGGDDVTDWVAVALVDPPAIGNLQLVATLPDYTGPQRQRLPEGSGPHPVLAGSSLAITATANKPLQQAVLNPDASDPFDLTSDDGRVFRLTIPSEQLVGGKYVFELRDESGMQSTRPSAFTIAIREDRVPQVRATVQGISGLVTPQVVLPFEVSARDEFAITDARFSFSWLGDSSDSVRQEQSSPLPGISNQLGQLEISTNTRLDLAPFEIPTGVSLRLVVQATDNNTLNGPGVGESREFLLRVVTPAELRADLLRREIEQQQAFSLALKNQEQLTVDLRALVAAQRETPDADRAVTELMEMQRRQKIIGTNLAGIADRFESFVVEATNNRLDEPAAELDEQGSLQDRISRQIVQPIRDLDEYSIHGAAQSFDAIRRAADNPQDLATAARDTIELQEFIAQTMRDILAAMKTSESFQAIINMTIEVKKGQDEVKQQTEKRLQENRDRDIFEDDDLFEDDQPADQKAEESGDG